MYLLKLSMRPWRRSPLSQLCTSVAVGILLFLAGFLFWMQHGLGPVIERLTNEQVITAYLEPSLGPEGETSVVKTIDDTIRTTAGAHAEVQRVGTERFLSHLRESYPSLATELEDLGTDMQTVIPRYVSISGMLAPGALDQVRLVPGVQSAESSVDRFRNVVGAFRALRWIATLLTCGLALALLTGLIHLGRTNAHLHQDSSSLLELMGASPGTLRAPGLVSGLLVGLLGGLLAAVGWNFFGTAMAAHVRELSPVLSAMPLAGGRGAGLFALGLLLAGTTLGALSGALGNRLAGANRGK